MLKQARVRQATDIYQRPAAELVGRLRGDIVEGSCVVFVGAGSTTERGWQGKSSFYQIIRSKAAYPESETLATFPSVMEHFCKKLDGGRHNRLIREAISYIERFCLSGEEDRSATLATSLLATIPYFSRFVTTNWDPFIERSLDVLVPIIEDRDLAFWNDRKKQVLKIHGCITRPYSIVATQGDYDACMAKSPLIFNKLRDLMATKTFLFIGYSRRDADFQQVWASITGSLGHFAKLAYALDPNASPENVSFWHDRGIELFKTSDLIFLRDLRKSLEKDGLVPSEEFLDGLRRERRRIVRIHIKLDQSIPGGMASSMYQDGLLHGLDDVLTSTALGTKRNEDFEKDLSFANKVIRESFRKNDIIEVAYWTGRREIVERYCDRNRHQVPAYFHPNRLKPISKLVKGRG